MAASMHKSWECIWFTRLSLLRCQVVLTVIRQPTQLVSTVTILSRYPLGNAGAIRHRDNVSWYTAGAAG